MFLLPTIRTMFCSQMLLILRFHETYTVDCTGISLARPGLLSGAFAIFLKCLAFFGLMVHVRI